MRPRPMRHQVISWVLLAALMCVSCTTFKEVYVSDIEYELKAGDIVKVNTGDGRALQYRIMAVTPEAIVVRGAGFWFLRKDQRILRKEIITVEKEKFSIGKTAALVLLTAAGTALAIVLASSGNDSKDRDSGASCTEAATSSGNG